MNNIFEYNFSEEYYKELQEELMEAQPETFIKKEKDLETYFKNSEENTIVEEVIEKYFEQAEEFIEEYLDKIDQEPDSEYLEIDFFEKEDKDDFIKELDLESESLAFVSQEELDFEFGNTLFDDLEYLESLEEEDLESEISETILSGSLERQAENLKKKKSFFSSFFEEDSSSFNPNSPYKIEDSGESQETLSEPFLPLFSIDITSLAEQGKIEECFGRDKELAEVMEILARRQKNNPVLLGEPGVGKTAIIELFATKIIKNLVPFILQDRRIISLDLAKVLAGSKYRGEFELRIQKILEEVLDQPNITLFIDEIHNITGAGSVEGSMDAANMLKPILSRSGFQCIGATTNAEYSRIEKDPALNRRFQPVKVSEPSLEDAINILQGLRPTLEAFHNVSISSQAIKASVELSSRYIYDRFLPDKAIDLVDRASAKEVIKFTSLEETSAVIAILNSGLIHFGRLRSEAFRRGDIPAVYILQELENAYRNYLLRWVNKPTEALKADNKKFNSNKISKYFYNRMKSIILAGVDRLLFESNIPNDCECLTPLEIAQVSVINTYLKTLRPVLQKSLVESFKKSAKIKLSNIENSALYNLLGYFSSEKGHSTLSKLKNEPKELQNARKRGDFTKLKIKIDEENIKVLISNLTGIPLQSVSAKDLKKLEELEKTLKNKIIGQTAAVEAISKAIRRSRLGVQNPNRPIASFLFCGPTGVGKTEVTKVLSSTMLGSEDAMIRLDMSEFMEKFAISRLIGSPPGYVGYEEGGQLTNAVRKKPYSVILFDEIEKANPDILNILLQILDDGRLTDSQKRLVLFNNTIIIMTSNAAAQDIQKIVKTYSDLNTNEAEQNLDINNPNLVTKTPFNESITFLRSNNIIESYQADINNNLDGEFGKSFSRYQKMPYAPIKQQKESKEDMTYLLKKAVLDKLGTIFLPEFLNRLDDIIIFSPLSADDLAKIAEILISNFSKRLIKSNNIKVCADHSVYLKLAKEGYNPAFGARPLRRLVVKYIEDIASDFIIERAVGLSSNHDENQMITLNFSTVEDTIVFKDII